MYESKLGVAFLIAAQSNGDRHFALKVPFQDTRLLQYQKVIYFFIFIFAFKNTSRSNSCCTAQIWKV